MAEGTRLQELARNTETRIHEVSNIFKDSIKRIDGRIDAMEERMNEVQKSLTEVNDTMQGIMIGVQRMNDRARDHENNTDRSGNNRGQRSMSTCLDSGRKGVNQGFANMKVPKIELKKFGGNNPREWIKKCQRFFTLNPVAEEQKVLFASLHLDGIAETWFQNCYDTIDGVSWEEFVESLCGRFAYEGHENIVGEFNKLQQVDGVSSYQERFEFLRPLVLAKNKSLSEEFFVDSFLSGLKDEIKFTVQMFSPKTLNHVFSLARLQEVALDNARKNKFPPKFNNSSAGTNNSSVVPTIKGINKGSN